VRNLCIRCRGGEAVVAAIAGLRRRTGRRVIEAASSGRIAGRRSGFVLDGHGPGRPGNALAEGLYRLAMGMRNYLIEGVSGTGKTSVCEELQRRGYHAIHGDRELAYRGDPETGEPTDGFKFIGLFDGVFVLEVDLDTLNRRLDERPDDEWGGGKPPDREFVARLHQTKEDIPRNGIVIDATAPIARVVDEIVRRSEANRHL
jgi:hypothetical protein